MQQPFLYQQKKGNDRRKYLMINLHESMGPAGIEIMSSVSAKGDATDCVSGPNS